MEPRLQSSCEAVASADPMHAEQPPALVCCDHHRLEKIRRQHTLLQSQNCCRRSQFKFHVVSEQRPDLVAQGFLADYVAQQALFTFWLPDMCNKSGGPSTALYQTITQKAHSEGHFLMLMGYFPSQEVWSSSDVALLQQFAPKALSHKHCCMMAVC